MVIPDISIPALIDIISKLFVIIGVLAFLTSVVIEVIKKLTPFKTIPTDLLVFVVAILLTELSIIIYGEVLEQTFLWYIYVAAIFGGIFVAYVAMNGWTKINELWQRYKYKSNQTE